MTTIDRYIQDFSAMLGLAPERVSLEPYDCIGEQLGRAIAPMVDAEADERAELRGEGRIVGVIEYGKPGCQLIRTIEELLVPEYEEAGENAIEDWGYE